MKKHTILRPGLGYNTMSEVYGMMLDRHIKGYLHYSENPVSFYMDWRMSQNPYAFDFIQEYPHYFSERGISDNKSEESFYLRKTMGMSYVYNLCFYINFPTLDTYLHDIEPEIAKFSSFEKECFFDLLSCNPRAISFLEKNLDKVNWKYLSENPAALDLLEQHPEKINFKHLSLNPNPRAAALLRENLSKIDWILLAQNTSDEAIAILEEHPEKFHSCDRANTRCNLHPRAFRLWTAPKNNHYWFLVAKNPSTTALEILKQNPEHIQWSTLCRYASIKPQFDFIRSNIEKVSWEGINDNSSPYATALLEEHPEKIDWEHAIEYHNLFETTTEYDYAGIREARHDLHEEFHSWAGHPSKIATKWRDWGFETYGVEEAEEC